MIYETPCDYIAVLPPCDIARVQTEANACEVGNLVYGAMVKADSCQGSLSWRYDEAHRAFVKGGKIAANGNEARYFYANFTRCT